MKCIVISTITDLGDIKESYTWSHYHIHIYIYLKIHIHVYNVNSYADKYMCICIYMHKNTKKCKLLQKYILKYKTFQSSNKYERLNHDSKDKILFHKCVK